MKTYIITDNISTLCSNDKLVVECSLTPDVFKMMLTQVRQSYINNSLNLKDTLKRHFNENGINHKFSSVHNYTIQNTCGSDGVVKN